MGIKTAILSLLVGFVTVVTSQSAPGLPVFTSVETRTSQDEEGALIIVEYLAPEKPYILWYVNGLPLAVGGSGYKVINEFDQEGQKGKAIISSEHDKSSIYVLSLHSFDGEICLILAPLAQDRVVREDLDFPWAELTPETDSCKAGKGEGSVDEDKEEEEAANHWKHDASAADCKAKRDDATGGLVFTYSAGNKLQIHAPAMDTPHHYFYTAMLLSKNPSDPEGNMLQGMNRDMEGGEEGDMVTMTPVGEGKGWTMDIRTDQADYEGVLMLNTTYIPHKSEAVLASFNIQPFTYQQADSSGPFSPGFVAGFPNPVTWQCRADLECMVVCPFATNGDISVTFSRLADGGSESDTENVAAETEESVGFIKMLGPFLGYGAIFIPAFQAESHAGTYKCVYKTESSTAVAMVEVN